MPDPYFAADRVTLYLGDCVEVMRALPEASVDAVVTDPPYGLEFMGKEWDGADGFRRSLNPADVGRENVFGRTSAKAPEYRTAGVGRRGKPGIGERQTDWVSNKGWNEFRCGECGHLLHGGSPCQCPEPKPVRADNRWNLFQAWNEQWATEALRVLKPGAHLLAFGGTRTFHRLTCALEDAGFEIRDCLMWLYGSGFPKSLDVSKAIDKAAGVERPTVPGGVGTDRGYSGGFVPGRAYSGEPQTAAAAAAWRGWGTALKPAWEPIILARKPLSEPNVAANVLRWGTGAINVDGGRIATDWETDPTRRGWQGGRHPGNAPFHQGDKTLPTIPRGGWEDKLGRWPANLILNDESAALLDEQSGERPNPGSPGKQAAYPSTGVTGWNDGRPQGPLYFDTGGASRFFYTAKADKDDRAGSKHPTVKPTDLMAYLVRLVTPPGGLVLDPFCGSGPTVWAAREYGFRVIGCDREQEYLDDTVRRLRQEVLPL